MEEYAKAAKAVGLSFLVFNDPLEKLTSETLDKLKADCAAVSKDSGFYACPGIEFTDGVGNRWAFWGERVRFPRTSFREGKQTYVQWDGARVRHYGEYAYWCQCGGSALLDYQQFRRNGCHPENLWWFFHYFPLVYDKDRLIADNVSEYLFGLRDLRNAGIASFTRIRNPADVATASAALFTDFDSLPQARHALNTNWGPSLTGSVSQGPKIAMWSAIPNDGNWRYTRGAQRWRLKFDVRSEAGIAEVKVHDADTRPLPPFRRPWRQDADAGVRNGARQAALSRIGGSRQPRQTGFFTRMCGFTPIRTVSIVAAIT